MKANFTVTPVAWFVSLTGLVLGLGLGPRAPRADEPVPPAELSEETHQIRSELQDVGLRLQRLANKVNSTDPEDAKRMIEAVDKIHSSDLGRVIDEIGSLLSKSNFIEALGRQDRALEELDAIIRILERTRFESPDDLEKRTEELKAILQATEETAKKQDSLLQKTKDFLDRVKALGSLKDLKTDLQRLKDAQASLNQGADPEKVDPGADQADQKALSDAQEAASRLKAEQDKLNERMSKLPGTKLPIGDLKALREKLDALVAEGEKLAAEGEQARDAEADLKSIAGEAKGSPRNSKKSSQGSVDKTGGQKAQGESTAPRDSGEAREGEKVAGKDAGEKASGEKAGGEKTSGDKVAGEKAGGETAGGEKTGAKNAEKDPAGGGDKPGERTPETKTGPSDLELARRAEAAREAKEKLGSASKAFAGKLGDLSKEVSQSGDVPEGAKQDLTKSSQGAQAASQDLQKGDLTKAVEGEKKAIEDLKRARDQIAKDLAKAEEQNTAETAGLQQEQGILETRTEEASSKASQSASKSSSQSAKSALEQGSEAMTEAGKAMQEAAEAQQGGDRQKAQASGAKARDALSKAESAFSKGQKDVAARSAAEKAADLQKKLAKKTEEARKLAEELQKKLRKKEDESRGAKLGDTQGSLSKASGAMQEASDAQKKGQNELAKKKGEEALAELEKAQAGVAEEERDELARLEKDKLKKNAPEQEQLARLTKELSKKAQSASKGSQSGDSSQQLDEASASMDEASQDLDKEQGEEAQKAQEEALAKLKNTKEELRQEEERLERLKREQEMLSLVASLTEVKEGQEKVNGDTVRIDAGREKTKDGQPNEGRRQRLRVQQEVEKVVAREGELADQVDSLNQKLKEEYARVFTFVLKNVSVDMRQVRDSLKELDTGTYTQFLEREIVTDIERLIAALKEQMEKPEQGEQPPGGEMPPSKPRLVPTVAELRMLKEMQLDVNRGTRDLEDLRKASAGSTTESWKKALDRLLQKQGSVSRMTGELVKDFKEAQSAGEGGEGEGEKPEPDEHENHD